MTDDGIKKKIYEEMAVYNLKDLKNIEEVFTETLQIWKTMTI